MDADALLQAIADSPDNDDDDDDDAANNDAARLVWADHVGGDRGELVVLQCALTNKKSGLSSEERRRYLRRERELLTANGSRWASAEGAPEATFVRGFPAALRIGVEDFANSAPEIAKRAPLVRHIELGIGGSVSAFAGPTAREEWQSKLGLAKKGFAAFPENRIRSIATDPTIWTDGDWASPPSWDSFGDELVDQMANHIPALRGLRSLDLRGGAPTLAASLPNLERFAASLVSLEAPFEMSNGVDDRFALLDGLPNLRKLGRLDNVGVRGKDLVRFLGHPAIARMESLHLSPQATEDFELLGNAANLSQLEALHLSFPFEIPSVTPLSRFTSTPHLTNLRSLFISGHINDYTIEAFAESPFAKNLRVLSIAYTSNLRARIADIFLSEFPSLESLRIQGTGELLRRANDLRAVIPDVQA
jgi:hypothetical protein